MPATRRVEAMLEALPLPEMPPGPGSPVPPLQASSSQPSVPAVVSVGSSVRPAQVPVKTFSTVSC